jgi:hypothetical protein
MCKESDNSLLNPDTQQKDGRFAASVECLLARRLRDSVKRSGTRSQQIKQYRAVVLRFVLPAAKPSWF